MMLSSYKLVFLLLVKSSWDRNFDVVPVDRLDAYRALKFVAICYLENFRALKTLDLANMF